MPEDLHELLSFEDPDEQRTWVFDVTFLTSPWTCIFGRGCPGVLTGPAPEREEGCCSYGAHFVDDADHDSTLARIASLTDEQWQYRARAARTGATKQLRDGQWTTRLADGACIMLNRPGFPGGAGCALHRAAVEADERPIDWKPDVCWQLPLRVEDHTDANGWVTSHLREWKRRDWGGGGTDFHWWCTDDPLAFVGTEPAYVALRDEIVEMVGEPAYALLEQALRARRASRDQPVAHPVLRRR